MEPAAGLTGGTSPWRPGDQEEPTRHSERLKMKPNLSVLDLSSCLGDKNQVFFFTLVLKRPRMIFLYPTLGSTKRKVIPAEVKGGFY